MHILDAAQLTTAQNGTRIMRLKNILQNYCDMPCAEVEHLLETLLALIGDKLGQELKHGRVTGRIQLRFSVLQFSSVIHNGFLHVLFIIKKGCKNTKKEKITKK
jgi:hypothetical protein